MIKFTLTTYAFFFFFFKLISCKPNLIPTGHQRITLHPILFLSRTQKVGHATPKPSLTTELSLIKKKKMINYTNFPWTSSRAFSPKFSNNNNKIQFQAIYAAHSLSIKKYKLNYITSHH